jgi:site-specific DNA recombinase
MDTRQEMVALYVRVSTAEQATEGVSIDAQLAALRTYAKLQRWQITGEYVDAGYSGGSDERPSLQRLLSDARKGKFNIIAVAKLDRFFRNLRVMLNCLHEMEGLGIKFIATQEGLDTSTPYGKFAVQIMGTISEFERGRIGERVRDGRHYRVSQGRWPSGRTLYGYRWLPREQKWEVIEKEAEVVRYIFHLYLSEGLGSMKIPLRLNKEGCRTRQGSRWGFHSLHRILSHPGYKGMHRNGIRMPPIIDEATWDMAQEKRRKARQVRRNPRNWLLQGRCICGECGHVLSCIRKDKTEHRYYSCHGRYRDTHLDGSPKCTLPRVRADLLEKAVWRRLKTVLTDSQVLRETFRTTLNELRQRRSEMGKATESIDRELQTICSKKERLGLAYADGAVIKEVYDSKLGILKKRESELLAARSNLDPRAGMELDELEQQIARLEKVVDGKSGPVMLTELGILATDMPPYGVIAFPAVGDPENSVTVGAWDEPTMIQMEDFFRLGDNGPLVRMVDGPGSSAAEVPREMVWQNIRRTFETFSIRVYVFRDRVEIRGFIPTEVMDIPRGGDRIRGGSIIPSVRGRGLRG